MGLQINTNSVQQGVLRALNSTQTELNTSLQRLASGLRINSAADDAAGLSISSRITAAVRGLNQAVRNGQDGVSVAQTAEAGLSGTEDNLQRLRELALQSANGSYSDSDRTAIQKEAGQIIDEINRTSTDTEFGGQKLLNGSLNLNIQVGANANQVIKVSVQDSSANTLGTTAQTTVDTTGAALTGNLAINGQAIRATAAGDDNKSTANAAGSAIALAKAVNEQAGTTGVTATVGETSVTGAAAAGGTLASGDIKINGVNIGAVTLTAGDANSALSTAINAVTGQTGVTATVSDAGELVLTATDGRNVDVQSSGVAATTASGLSSGTTTGEITLSSDSSFQITGSDATAALALSSNTTVQLDTSTAVGNVNLGTQDGANAALASIDAALKQVSSRRATLGAVQNRFASASISNQISSENLQAARSRITDADFAKEMASNIRSQLLQSAGLNVLNTSNGLNAAVVQNLLR